MLGFLIGFLSQSRNEEAYIHFVGIHPAHRQRGIGRQLYETYFNEVNKRGLEIVRCITSPIHTSSIAYYTRMGFVIEKGDKRVEGIEIHSIGSIQPSDNRRFLCMLESAWE